MPEIEDEKDMDKLDIDEDFVYGRNVIAQKSSKEVGQAITYYRVIEKTKRGSVVYTPIFDYLEED
jgi:hypothetical protein